MMQRLEAAQAQYNAAEAAAEDFELIASLGKALHALQQESAQLPLSEEDYLVLAASHAQLLQRVEERCTQLKKAKDFTALEQLGVHAAALTAVNLPTVQPGTTIGAKAKPKASFGALLSLGAAKAPEAPSKTDLDRLLNVVSALDEACVLLSKQVSQVPQRAEMTQRLENAQAQYDAAFTAFADFPLITSLGAALVTMQQESAQLPLSEEDYLTLADRHAALVQRVKQGCLDLMKAKQFDNLAILNGRLRALDQLELPKGD
jgi:hypothetical protein